MHKIGDGTFGWWPIGMFRISGQPMAIRLEVDVMTSNASNPVGAQCDKNRILVHQGGKGSSCNE